MKPSLPPRTVALVLGAMAVVAFVYFDTRLLRARAPASAVATPAARGGDELPPRWRLSRLVTPLALLGSFEAHKGGAFAVALSPAGDLVLSGGTDGTAVISNVATGKLVRALTRHTARVSAVAWSPDGSLVATAGDVAVILADARTSKTRFKLDMEGAPVTSVDFSPDGTQVAAGSLTGIVRTWSTSTGAVLAHFDHGGHVFCVRFSPDGESLASAGDEAVRIWRLPSAETTHTLVGHRRSVESVAWSPDGKRLASVGDDRTLRVWSTSSAELQRRAGDAEGDLSAVAWGPSGQLATAGREGIVRVYDTTSWKLAATRDLRSDATKRRVLGLAWSRDGVLVAADATGRISILGKGAPSRLDDVPPIPADAPLAIPWVTPAEGAYSDAMALIARYDGHPASLDKPESLLRAALGSETNPASAIVLVGLARVALRRGLVGVDAFGTESLATADALVARALALAPGLAAAHLERGWLSYYEKDNVRASEEAQAADKLARTGRSQSLLAVLATSRNDLGPAEAFALAAIGLSPRDDLEIAYLTLARVHQARGDYAATERSFERAIALAPPSGTPVAAAAFATFLVLRGQFDRGIALAEGGLGSTNGADAPFRRQVVAMAHTEKGAEALWADREPELAKTEFERALAVDPGDAHAHYGLGAYYRRLALELGDRSFLVRSNEELERAMKLDLDSTLARTARAQNDTLSP